MRKTSGFVKATVVDHLDPEGLGRVRVRIPEDASEAWAERASFLAGNGYGAWFGPEIGDEVLVAYEGSGARRSLYVIGGLWHAGSPPPTGAAGQSAVKLLQSRSGASIKLDDTAGREGLVLETPGGRSLRLLDAPGALELRDGNGSTIRLDAGGVTIETSGQVSVRSGQIVLEAGQMKIHSGLATFDGVVECQTLIAKSVVSASYTPGAGNIM